MSTLRIIPENSQLTSAIRAVSREVHVIPRRSTEPQRTMQRERVCITKVETVQAFGNDDCEAPVGC